MKTIDVVAALIVRDGRIFATQRGYGDWKGHWEYPTFHLSMRCYLCSIVSGSLTLLEHDAAVWLDRDHLRSVQWLPADEAIIGEIEAII